MREFLVPTSDNADIVEKMRPGFERWAVGEAHAAHPHAAPEYFTERREDGEYASLWMRGAWSAWLRKSGVSELSWALWWIGSDETATPLHEDFTVFGERCPLDVLIDRIHRQSRTIGASLGCVGPFIILRKGSEERRIGDRIYAPQKGTSMLDFDAAVIQFARLIEADETAMELITRGTEPELG